jgi:hypothetical protein
MKRINKLNASLIAKAVPGTRHGDGGGLWLQVDRHGNKSWIYRYTIAGRARAMGLGSTITVSLAGARGPARDGRRLLLDGVDPITAKHSQRKKAALARASGMTFSECAAAYLSEHGKTWTNDKHRKQWETSLARASSADSSIDRLSHAASGPMSYIRIMICRATGHIMLPIRRCQPDALRKSAGLTR